jgi:hypothetical protein
MAEAWLAEDAELGGKKVALKFRLHEVEHDEAAVDSSANCSTSTGARFATPMWRGRGSIADRSGPPTRQMAARQGLSVAMS